MASRKLRWRKDGKVNLPIEDALWQYLLDHVSHVAPDGFMTCTFGVSNREQFMRSVEVRQRGKYRWSEDDIQDMHKKSHSKHLEDLSLNP